MQDHSHECRPLKIAALIKQVPLAESLVLGPDGRLEREGMAHEMNPYCRRAVAKGVELAKSSGGTCTVFTLGPPSAEDVLREAIAWGADAGVHLCDIEFAGSDTLATARALSKSLEMFGPFDLILVGRNSVDGDTGQVGPEIAQMLDLAFACGVREIELEGDTLSLELEYEDGWEEMEVKFPLLMSVAERLCDPCKVEPERRAEVDASKIKLLRAADLGAGPWGDAGSPTKVGEVRTLVHQRLGIVTEGTLPEQIDQVVQFLRSRNALKPAESADIGVETVLPLDDKNKGHSGNGDADRDNNGNEFTIVVLLEDERDQLAAELLGAASQLVNQLAGQTSRASSGQVVAFTTSNMPGMEKLLGQLGATEVILLEGEPIAEDVSRSMVEWIRENSAWAVLAPSTAYGREVAGRVAATLGCGLVGDAVGVEVVDGELVAAKPAFSGALVADISCVSPVRLVTIRPGVLSIASSKPNSNSMNGTLDAKLTRIQLIPRGRVRMHSKRRDDDIEVLARADVVIGVGAGVAPEDYEKLSPIAAILGADLAATRKVTDRGWAPRARQVGITGRSIAPRLYVALASSGKFNHMVGVRSAGTILAINSDPEALVFSHSDIGIVGDWLEVVSALGEALRAMTD